MTDSDHSVLLLIEEVKFQWFASHDMQPLALYSGIPDQ